MKLWMVTNTGEVGYDEYDSFVVRAPSAEYARELVAEEFDSDWNGSFVEFWLTSPVVYVSEVTAEGEPSIILGSFNAG